MRPRGTYEHKAEPIASIATFRTRLLRSATLAFSIVGFSLALGIAGYHWIVGTPDWLDCLLSASMILGGMGPIGPQPTTPAGKVFASFYALYCGVILLVSVGLLLTPVAHRLMHRLHVEVDDAEDSGDR
jgi:hypothetical protein